MQEFSGNGKGAEESIACEVLFHGAEDKNRVEWKPQA